MYIFKNAYLNIKRALGRNMLIGSIIMIITIAACVTITIKSSGDLLVKSYTDNNPLEVTFNLNMQNMRNASENDRSGIETISIDLIDKIGSLKEVNGYYYKLNSTLNSDQIEAIDLSSLFGENSNDNGGESPKGGFDRSGGNGKASMGDFEIIAYNDISYDQTFIKGERKLSEGEMIGEQKNTIMISQDLALENELKVGDQVTFQNTSDSTKNYTFTIIGTYENSVTETNGNSIITNVETLNDILGDTETLNSHFGKFQSISSAFYMDYEDYDKFVSEARKLGVSDYYEAVNNESEILASVEPIKNVAEFSKTFLLVVLIIGATVLTIINLFNIRERKYEIGVLRAIGMTKGKVMCQLTIELLMITASALIIGTSIGLMSSQKVTNYMLEKEITTLQTKTEEINDNFGGPGYGRPNKNHMNQNKEIDYLTDFKVTTNPLTIIYCFLIGIGLTIISSTVAVLNINKYEPNRILQNRN